jgi:hypothetical protein
LRSRVTHLLADSGLNLIDGSGLLALCQQYDIPARILNSKRKPTA